jgi:hypothetical protein
MEIAELYRLYQQWGEHGNSGTLELDTDGSGGIRMSDPDDFSGRLVVSWSSLEDGVRILLEQLTSGCPAASEYYRSIRPRQRTRTRRPATTPPAC